MSVQTYAEFLAHKTRSVGNVGHDVEPGDIHHSLHDWQREITRWAIRAGRCAIWADTGLGKSRMQIEWARLSGSTSLIVAPLAVSAQTAREAARIGIDAQYVRSADQITGKGVWITNYEMVDRFNPAVIDSVVLDECFAPGTLIDVPGGRRRIEDIRAGEYIINATGIDVVSDVHRRDVPYAVAVKFAGREVTSSPNHPYFTQRGWIGAQDLIPGDSVLATTQAVRMVQEAIRPEVSGGFPKEILRSILLSEMADEPAGAQGEGAQSGSCSQAWRQTPCMAGVGLATGDGRDRSDQEVEPDPTSRGPGEDIPHLEIDEPRSLRAWGKWPWLNRAAAEDAGCTWVELAGGVCHIVGPTGTWVSDELQTRFSVSRTENRYRAGWQLAPQQTTIGCEEGHEAGFTRLDGVEILERDDPRLAGFRDGEGRLRFYDLGATRHPSYSVGGHLVHNSSILKAHDGKTRTKLIRHFASVPRRLSCTATPAPNDPEELTNQAEFLGVCSRVDMLATYFIHDDDGWRLKRHAVEPMYDWMTGWALALRRPSDLGYSDDGYILPGLEVIPQIVETTMDAPGQLFATDVGGVGGRARVRRETLRPRCGRVAELVDAERHRPWILWCGLNAEADLLAKLVPNSINVHGTMRPEEKAELLLAFADGEYPVLITKPSIAGFGLNYQHCADMAFVGINDSFEQYYQCIRRCHRYGQTRTVRAHVVVSELEQQIADNVARKERGAASRTDGMIRAMRRKWMVAA